MGDVMEICTAASFEAAHYLSERSGSDGDEPESNTRLHGHSFRVEVCVAGRVGSDGRVVSTDVLSGVLGRVVSRLDHRLLNEIDGLGSPTLENLCLWVREAIEDQSSGLRVSRVTLSRPSLGQRCVLRSGQEMLF